MYYLVDQVLRRGHPPEINRSRYEHEIYKTYLSFFNVGQMVEKELPLTGQSEKSTTTPRNARLEMISSIICGQSVEHLACPHVLVSNSRGKQNELTLF